MGLLCATTATAADDPDLWQVPRWEMPRPVPRPTLLDPADEPAPPEPWERSADPLLFQPDLAAIGRQNSNASLHQKARQPIPVDIIRNGFSARSNILTPAPERSVGFKLGREIFSLSTTLVRPENDAPGADARIGWQASHALVPVGSNLIWQVSTGGSSSLNGNPEQTGGMVIGFRHTLLPHLTLTPQFALNSNYVFVRGDGWHSSFTSGLKLSADLSRMIDLPWQTSFDLDVSRRVPLVASDFETAGTAMLRLKYTLQ